MKRYNREENEKVLKFMNWLGFEGFRFVQTLSDKEKEIQGAKLLWPSFLIVLVSMVRE